VDKIVKTVLTVIGISAFGVALYILFPPIRTSLLFIVNTIWIVIKEFFLRDILKKYVVYIILWCAVALIFGYVSRKTENGLWNLVTLLFLVLEILVYNTL